MASVIAKSASKATHKNESKQKENVPLEFMPMQTEYGVMPFRPSCACGGSCPRCRSGKSSNQNLNQQPVPIQTRLAIGKPDDAYEMEADHIADRVMRIPASAQSANDIGNSNFKIQRTCATCESEKEDPVAMQVQRYSAHQEHAAETSSKNNHQTTTIDDTHLTSGGSVLGSPTRDFFESRFNRDLSAVRLHTGTAANDYCQLLDAHAFTYGNHVWLGKGLQASPSFVLAHELAHVVQQTQPNTLNTQSNVTTSTQSQRLSANTIQRLPFWVPIDTKLGDVMSGTAIHSELLKNPEGKNKVTTEAPVPNANRKDWGLGLQGFADLYRASSRVGVFFQPPTGLSRGDQNGKTRHTNPAKPDRAGKTPKPVLTKTGTIDEIGSGPTDIELGELKPAAKSELSKGNDQLKHYEKGFEDTAKLTNLWGANHKITTPWNLNPVKRLPDNDVAVADKHKPGSASAPDRDLALADIDESSSGKSKYAVKKLFVPKPYLGQNIPGKLFMEPFGQGLWMYYAKPNDFSKALDVAKFKTDKAYMKVAEAVQGEVIGNLTKGPKKITLFHRRHQNAAGVPYATPTHAPAKIFRKAKSAKLKDDFDKTAYDNWSKRQSELGQEVRGKGTVKGADDPYKKLEFLEFAAKAESELSPKAKTPNFPTTAQLKEQIVTGKGADQVTKDTSLDKLYPWLERWTSYPYKILGQFRLRFGGVFVTAVNKFNEIKESISKKVHDYFANHPKAKKAASVLFKALKIALKQVVNIIVPRTLHLVMDAIENGAKKKLEELFEDSFVEKSIDKFKGWWEDIKDYGEKAKQYIEKVKKDFLEKFDWVEPLIDDVKWIWRIIKAGRVILKCRKPPYVGCLALLLDDANDHELNCVLCIPWVQKQIGSVVMALPWFSNIPPRLGNLIMETLRDAVPDNAKILRDIFSEKIPSASADIEDIVPECDTKCDGFGFFKTGGSGGEVSKSEGEEAQKMSDFRDKLSKEQVKDLLKEAERQGQLDKPFDQKKAEEMLKEAEKNRAKEAEKGADDKKAEPDKPKDQGQEPAPQKPPAPPAQKPQDQKKTEPPKDQKQPDKPPEAKPKDTPKPPKKPSKPPKKPEGAAGPASPQKGGGTATGGTCVWSPADMRVTAWIQERLDTIDLNSQVLAHGNSSSPFDNRKITRDCSLWIKVKNDFQFDCFRTGKFTKPVLTTEIIFNGKQLFKQTDKNPPFVNEFLAVPNWSSHVKLDPIRESGDLQVKITMLDPDSGTVRTFDDKIKIEIVTKDKCCDCIS